MIDPFASLGTIKNKQEEDPFASLGNIIPKKEEIPQTAQVPWWMSALRTGAETAGSFLGETAGTPFGLAGRTIGGALGYAVPNIAVNSLEEVLGYREKPKSLFEAFGGKALREGAEVQMAGGIAGKALAKGAQLAYAPFGERLSSETGKELLGLYEKYGIKPVPSELAKGGLWQKTLGIFEGILGYRPLTGDVMLKRSLETLDSMNSARRQLIDKGADNETVEIVGKRIRDEARTLLSKYTDAKGARLDALVTEFENKFGFSTTHEAGARFQTIMESVRTKYKADIDLAEESLGDMLPMKGADEILLPNSTKAAEKLLEKELSGKLPTKRTVSVLEKFKPKEIELPEGVSQEMLSKDPELQSMVESMSKEKASTWNGMRETKAKLQDRVQRIYRETNGKGSIESDRLKTMVNAIKEDMKQYAKSVGDDVWSQYEKNNKLESRFYDLFDKDLMGVMKTDPNLVARKIIKSGDITLMRQIQALAGDEGISPIRQVYFKEMVDEGIKKNKLPDTITKTLDTLRKQGGQEAVDTLLTKEQQNTLDNIIKVGKNFEWRMKNLDVVEFLDTIGGGSTDRIVDMIFKPRSTGFIKIAKKVLPDERLNELKSMALEKVLKEGGSGNFLPVSSAKQVAIYRDSLKELMPEKFKDTMDFVKLGQYMNQVEKLALNPSQTGQILVGSGMIGQAATNPKSLVASLGIPYIAARIYMSEPAMKWFSKAKVLPSMMPESMSYFSKALAIALKNESQEAEMP